MRKASEQNYTKLLGIILLALAASITASVLIQYLLFGTVNRVVTLIVILLTVLGTARHSVLSR